MTGTGEAHGVDMPAAPVIPTPLRTISVAGWLLAVTMAGAVVTGLVTAEEGAAGAMLANVWGRVTVIDLYLALGTFGAWVAWRERSARRALGWAVALVVTGSIAVGVYLALAAGRSRTMTELMCGPMEIGPD